MTFFLKEHPDFFNWVLSPTEYPNKKFIFCAKRRPLPQFFLNLFRSTPARSSSKSFIQALQLLTKDSSDEIHLIVIDDLALLEAVSHWKWLKGNARKIRIDFSYHGHWLNLPPSWGQRVDHVFFLTHAGYQDTILKNDIFTPRVHIVGNGTDGKIFFPLSSEEKRFQKQKFGYKSDTPILLWVSNPRPQKGLKLFLELSKKLQNKYPELHILIIGNQEEVPIQNPYCRALGRISNDELAKYLQIGDFYCFTSLWKEGFGLSLIEAAKCGNQVIASRLGGIPEVVRGLQGAYLVEEPNRLENWESVFDMAWRQREFFVPNVNFLAKYHELRDWQFRFFQALNS